MNIFEEEEINGIRNINNIKNETIEREIINDND